MTSTTSQVWLQDEEIYLHSIQKSCEHLSHLYLKKYKQCKSLQTGLKLPAIIIGSFTGITSFGTDSFPKNGQKFVSIAVGIVSICIAILNTIESYLKVGENTNSAMTAATSLQKLREDINRELSLPVSDRCDNGIVFLRDIYTRYQQILTSAPILDSQENMAYIDTTITQKINAVIRSFEYYKSKDHNGDNDEVNLYQTTTMLPQPLYVHKKKKKKKKAITDSIIPTRAEASLQNDKQENTLKD
jgi:hypothetical protein|uniref:SMODS and SLOG-associating 2TM effector domain-containing protein n=1 Tax=viral metagenome TaxID=1070528 RepID=A0A6C0BGQ6_9ZZZZ